MKRLTTRRHPIAPGIRRYLVETRPGHPQYGNTDDRAANLAARDELPPVLAKRRVAHIDVGAQDAAGQQHRVDVADESQEVLVGVLKRPRFDAASF